ncbi:MAG TPA: signal peptidase I [Marmoricola sp.]|nr:signal peptidase I [Marmoricola sp.]
MRRRSRELALTASAVLGVACIVVAALCVVLDLRLLSFRSGSMSPTIRTGALSVARTVDASDLRRGDIVSVHTATGSRVTHRIVAVTVRRTAHGSEATLVLRGDGNRVADPAPYVVHRADRVLFSVPLLGYVGAWFASPVGLVLVGAYLCYLLSVLLSREGPGPQEPSQHRGTAVASASLAVVLVLTGGAAAAALSGRSAGTLAAWTDGVTVQTGSLTARVIAPPASFNCGLFGVLSVSFTWSAVTGATSYTLHYGSGGAQTSTTTATSATLTSALAGGTAWVTTNVNYGSTTWTSAPSGTRSYSVAVFSVCT